MSIKSIFILSLCYVTCSFSMEKEQKSEDVKEKNENFAAASKFLKNYFQLSYGFFNVESKDSRISNFGATDIEAGHYITSKINLYANYGVILKEANDLGSVINSLSFGAVYCLVGCLNDKQDFGAIEVGDLSIWSLRSGLGLVRSTFQLNRSDLSLSGLSFRADLSYLFNEKYKIVWSNRFDTISNADQSLNTLYSILGIQYMF